MIDVKGRGVGEGQEQPRIKIMKGAAQNGNHEGRQMKGDKAAAAAKSETRRQRQPRAGDHEGGSPEWRS